MMTSCGSLTVKPIGCLGEGVWANTPKVGSLETELVFTESYYVWLNDYEVRLKDFLKKRDLDCRKISKIHIKMKSIFFVKRELTVFVQK